MISKKIIALMTTFERPQWAAAAALNLLNQTLKPSAIVVVAEKPADLSDLRALENIFKTYEIELHLLTCEGRGISVCKNHGISYALKKFVEMDAILFFDDGIFHHPNYIAELNDELRDSSCPTLNKIGAISGSITTFDAGSISHYEASTICTAYEKDLPKHFESGCRFKSPRGASYVQEYKNCRKSTKKITMPQVHAFPNLPSTTIFEADFLVTTFLITRSALAAIRPINTSKWFNEELNPTTSAGEEVDISRRIFANGFALLIVPAARAEHISIGYGGIYKEGVDRERYEQTIPPKNSTI